MSYTNSQPPHLLLANTQFGTRFLLLVLPLSGLFWGLSATNCIQMAMSQQEQSKTQPTEMPTPKDLRVQDLLKQPMPKFGKDAQKTEEIDFNSYRLEPGDAIAISVSPRSKDLSFNTTLDWQDNISVPLVGIVSLKNLTVIQAQEKIRTQLNEYIVNPQVGVVEGGRTLADGVELTTESCKTSVQLLSDANAALEKF